MAVAFGAVLFWGGFQPVPWLYAALVAVPLLELWTGPAGSLRDRLLGRWPAIVMAVSVLAVIALVPRLATQVGVAALYVVWRVLEARNRLATSPAVGAVQPTPAAPAPAPAQASTGDTAASGLLGLLAVQAVMLEAIFLFAATKSVQPGIILAVLYAGCFSAVYVWLRTRGERSAGLLAAVWALVASECGWVLLTWLVVYVTAGGYVIVPQPALVLTGLSYVFGGIYASSRANRLTRGRLGEYLLVGLLMIAIIVVGTKWQGTL